MNLVQKSSEVFVAPGPICTIGGAEIDFIRGLVSKSVRGRVRICTHQENSDELHEMFIAISPESYIRPHKHPGKSEAFHIVHGDVDIVIFDDAGNVSKIVELSTKNGSLPFYYRMSEPFFHTLVIKSELLVVHEITTGPFMQGATVFAPFAPPEDSSLNGVQFMTDLKAMLAARM